MIFKTFQSDLDGISNKLGFSKRSFVEWGKQVSTSFKESEGVVNSFKNALKAAFIIPAEKDSSWIKNSFGEIITKNNIDSLIPELIKEDASDLAQRIREQSIAVADATSGWEDYFSELKNKNQEYIVALIKNTDDLSKLTGEDLVKANQSARESAIAQNQALKQQTLGAKAATAAANALAMAGNMLVAFLVTKSIELFVKALDKSTDSLADVEARIQDNQDALSDYTSKIGELTEKLENLNNTDTTYLSDEQKTALETETAYVQSQIELYTLLAEAKQKALNEDYIKAATGENEELFLKKAWNGLRSGEWSNLLSTASDAADKQWLNMLFPGLGLFAKTDDGNYVSEADKYWKNMSLCGKGILA